MKKLLYTAMALLLIFALPLAACEMAPPEAVDPLPEQNGGNAGEQPQELPGEEEAETPQPEEQPLPESRLLTVIREGQSEQLAAQLTEGRSGLRYYLLPGFELGFDQGFDILMTSADSDYLPVSLTISNNSTETTAEQALELAQSYYPGVEFGKPYGIDTDGGMREALYSGGQLDGDWVTCVGLAGASGTVSAWGQGGLETAEGLKVLLLAQLCSVYQ